MSSLARACRLVSTESRDHCSLWMPSDVKLSLKLLQIFRGSFGKVRHTSSADPALSIKHACYCTSSCSDETYTPSSCSQSRPRKAEKHPYILDSSSKGRIPIPYPPHQTAPKLANA